MAILASCQDCPKDVGVLAVVMTELELRKIQRKIIFAHVMEGSDNSALQERPEAIQIGGVHFTANVLASGVSHAFMRIAHFVQAAVGERFICCDQIDLVADCLTDKAIQSARVRSSGKPHCLYG